MPTNEQARTREPQPEPAAAPAYWVVFFLLAVFTALEVAAASFAGLTSGIRIGVLVFLAVVKAALVLLYFMHLKYDSRIFALPFALGVVLIIPIVLVITLTMSSNPLLPEVKGVNAAGQVVNVEEVSYALHLSQDTVNAGPVTLHVVNNANDILHEFIIIKTDLPADDLPLDEMTGRVNEDAVNIVTAQDDIEPSHSRDITLNLDPGHYVLICNLPGGHYLQGMRVDFNVMGSSSAPASTSEAPPVAEPTMQTPAAGD